MFRAEKKNQKFLPENFLFLVVKFSIYFNRRVCLLHFKFSEHNYHYYYSVSPNIIRKCCLTLQPQNIQVLLGFNCCNEKMGFRNLVGFESAICCS